MSAYFVTYLRLYVSQVTFQGGVALSDGTALAWHARGAGFESPQDQIFMLVPSVLSLSLVYTVI